MSLMNVFDVAGTALTAQSIRLDTVSTNMANAHVVAPSEQEAYRARLPVFATMFNDEIGRNDVQGVEVRELAESRVAVEERYEPDHPLASPEGFVYEANVNMVEEMANMISASKSYSSNVEVMNTSKKMLQRALSLGSS